MTPKHGAISSSTATTCTTNANVGDSANGNASCAIARSSSARARHPDDPVLKPYELISTLKVGKHTFDVSFS